MVSGHQARERNACTDVPLSRAIRKGRIAGIKKQANTACIRIMVERDALDFSSHITKTEYACA